MPDSPEGARVYFALAEKMVDRFEGKLDRISDQLVQVAVANQGRDDRIEAMEKEIKGVNASLSGEIQAVKAQIIALKQTWFGFWGKAFALMLVLIPLYVQWYLRTRKLW